jgi:hypothetical protein
MTLCNETFFLDSKACECKVTVEELIAAPYKAKARGLPIVLIAHAGKNERDYAARNGLGNCFHRLWFDMIDIQQKFSGVDRNPTPGLRAPARAKMSCEIEGWHNAANDVIYSWGVWYTHVENAVKMTMDAIRKGREMTGQ